MWKIIVLCIVTTGSAAVFDKACYENYKVFSITPMTRLQLDLLKSLKKSNNIGLSFWQAPSWMFKEVDIMVPPHKLPEFYEIINKIGAPYKLKINNIQKLIDRTMPPMNQSQGFDFKNYHTLEEIYDNLDDLARQYPDKVQTVVGGRTYEGRQIKGVKVTFKEDNLGIFIEGGIHGREWIAPATVMYILHQLLTSTDMHVRYIAESHNWYFFPIFNPDGYVFTHTKDRLWRKTRKPSSPFCVGSDPNRNWDFRWNITGVSPDPCDENYPGSKPFSEVEMKSISEYIRSQLRYFYAYVSFHSYSQLLMFPYGYTTAHIFRHYDEMLRVGAIAAEALEERYKTKYQVGCEGEVYHLCSGISIDYIAGVFRKLVVFSYELRDRGYYGFLLPPEQIIPTGEETLDSLLALFSETISHGYAQNVTTL